MTPTLFPSLLRTIDSLKTQTISADRDPLLNPLVKYLREKHDQGQPALLHFICTHNSRRSHLAQVWAQVMAHHFDTPGVVCYSGGTEATAVAPLALEALRHAGCEVAALTSGANPVQAVKYGPNLHPVVAFSKVYDHPFNPQSHFAALMTCAEADNGCPFVAGAEARFPLHYDDPKAYDGTPEAAEKYRERSLQIAAEMYFVFGASRKR